MTVKFNNIFKPRFVAYATKNLLWAHVSGWVSIWKVISATLGRRISNNYTTTVFSNYALVIKEKHFSWFKYQSYFSVSKAKFLTSLGLGK